MTARRRIAAAQGTAAVRAAIAGDTSRATTATAVRFLLEELATREPGNAVEVRVPPFGVTQCCSGPKHTRGTPPNVIEMDAETWLALATGQLHWHAARREARITASGNRATLDGLLPLIP